MTELSREEVLKTWELACLETTSGIDAVMYLATAIYEAGIKKGKSIPMKYRRMEFNAKLQKELVIERAVSDRLLEALVRLERAITHQLGRSETQTYQLKGFEYSQRIYAEAIKAHDVARTTIAEVEAIRKEKLG